MKKVKAFAIPSTPMIQTALSKTDFSDCFATTNHSESLDSISKEIFGKLPKWVRPLLHLRNFLVKFLGLKMEMPKGYHNRFEPGGYVGFFKIFEVSSTEILLGLNDKHLDFRVSILKDSSPIYNIKVSTLVSFNNKLGSYYMKVVAPFHVLVIQSMIKQAFNPNATIHEIPS